MTNAQAALIAAATFCATNEWDHDAATVTHTAEKFRDWLDSEDEARI